MASGSPQLSRPASTQSSHGTEYYPLRDIAKSEKVTPFASSYYRQHTLAPNRINVDENQLSEEDWSTNAFALGIPCRDLHRSHPDVRRFTQKLQKRPRMSDKHVTELLLPLLQSVVQPFKTLYIKTDGKFHPDAVPNGSPVGHISNSHHAAWSMPVPIPRPNIAIGFNSKNFTPHELELQDGIISNAHREPCDLAKISQLVVGANTLFWPFFTIDVQKDSMEAAENASAGAASTCNNALALLAEAAEEPTIRSCGRDIFWHSRRAVQSFSLSIHNDSEGNGKMASLNLNSSQGGLSHNCAPIRTYALCNEHDVECLLSRLSSIFVWAENVHLQQITTLLENLDALMQLESGREHISDGFPSRELDGATNFGGSIKTSRRKLHALKNALTHVSPNWIRF